MSENRGGGIFLTHTVDCVISVTSIVIIMWWMWCSVCFRQLQLHRTSVQC